MDRDFTPADIERLFGGISHWKEPITEDNVWATLELAHDAYLPEHIAGIIDSLRPDFLRRCYKSGDYQYLAHCLAQVDKSYVHYDTDTEEVSIIGEERDVNKVGATLILESRVAGTSNNRPLSNRSDGITLIEHCLDSDSAVAPRVVPLIPSLENIAGLSSTEVPSQSEFIRVYLARLGQRTFLRAGNDRLVLVGDSRIVSSVDRILMQEFGSEVRFTTNIH